MTGMEHAIEQVANALHGDQCPEDPDLGEVCGCDDGHFYRMAEVAVDALASAGLLSATPLGRSTA